MRIDRLILGSLALALAGCPPPPSPPPGPDGGADAPSTTPIGPEGGTVEGEGARVIVPAGALGAPTSIAIAPASEPGPRGRTVLGEVIAITPHGARFDAPVTIELPLPETHAFVQVWTREDDPFASWERLDARIEDGTARVEVDHFSYFAMVDPGMTWELVSSAPEGSTFLDLDVHGDLLYALTSETVLRSADGVTWLEVAEGLPRTDGTLRLRDLASTDLGLLLGTSRGVFRFDGARWRDHSDGIPDGGAGQPASVDRITTRPPGNAFLAGSFVAGGERTLYVRQWSPAEGRWVAFAEIPGWGGAIMLEQLPYCLALAAGGRPSYWCISVPGGSVTAVDLGLPVYAPFVFHAEEIHYYGEIWLGTERDILRTERASAASGPHSNLPIRDGALAHVRDFLERPEGLVLVAASDPALVFLTTDGETFTSASEGLPTDFGEGVYRLASLRGVVYAMALGGIYRGRPSVLECGLSGDSCGGDGDCCAGVCTAGVCASDACGADGASCRRSSGCCSAYCAEGVCRVRDPLRCGTAGDACTSRSECCRGDCVDGECVDLTHCRCDPAGLCGEPDGCGGSCPGSCPSGTTCQQTAHGWDFCGVPCSDWRDCRRVEPNDDTYCCTDVDGTGTCVGTRSSCDTECAPEGAPCGALSGLGCCDPDPSDMERPICCPPEITGYANTCSCTQTVFP